MGTSVARNATELVNLVENGLGWDPYAIATEQSKEVWRVKATEAGKINAAIRRRPSVVTLENLTISYDYCVATKVNALTPFVLVTKIREALEWHQQPPVVTDLEQDIASAISYEERLGDEQSASWIGRFTRAQGVGRQIAYDQWCAYRTAEGQAPE